MHQFVKPYTNSWCVGQNIVAFNSACNILISLIESYRSVFLTPVDIVVMWQGLHAVMCLCVRDLKEKRLELSTQNLVQTYSAWKSLGMHWPWSQKVKCQGRAVTKCATGVGMHAGRYHTAEVSYERLQLLHLCTCWLTEVEMLIGEDSQHSRRERVKIPVGA